MNGQVDVARGEVSPGGSRTKPDDRRGEGYFRGYEGKGEETTPTHREREDSPTTYRGENLTLYRTDMGARPRWAPSGRNENPDVPTAADEDLIVAAVEEVIGEGEESQDITLRSTRPEPMTEADRQYILDQTDEALNILRRARKGE